MDYYGFLSVCVCVVLLTVVPIEIRTNPQNVQVPKDSTVTLSCRAIGPPGLSYQWFRKEDEVN